MMDRLTARSPKNNMAYLINVKPDEQDVESPYPNTLRCIMDSFNRLAAYEDTEWTPEEIKAVQAAISPIPFERYCEIMQAERDGRLAVLPCKVGELKDQYERLMQPSGDDTETYTTGYLSGHKNGQAELIAYLLQIDTGTREAAEKAADKAVGE